MEALLLLCVLWLSTNLLCSQFNILVIKAENSFPGNYNTDFEMAHCIYDYICNPCLLYIYNFSISLLFLDWH